MEITPGPTDIHFSLKKKQKNKLWDDARVFLPVGRKWKLPISLLHIGVMSPTLLMACRQAYAETDYQMFCCILQNNFCLWCRRVRHMARWRLSKEKMTESVSHSVTYLFATPWTVAHQTPLSMGFSRQEYWNGVPLPSPYSSYCY